MYTNQEDTHLNLPEAAAALRVSEVWMRKLLGAQPVPGASRVAGRWVFDPAAFLPWCKVYNSKPKRRARLTKK